MSPVRSAKPLVSALLAILVVLALVVPFLQFDYLAGPLTPFDAVQAGAIRWILVFGLAGLWLGVQLFWRATAATTKLGMAASATILWLSLALFFNYSDVNFGGAVAFFTLMGGLGIVLMWTHFMADEINF